MNIQVRQRSPHTHFYGFEYKKTLVKNEECALFTAGLNATLVGKQNERNSLIIYFFLLLLLNYNNLGFWILLFRTRIGCFNFDFMYLKNSLGLMTVCLPTWLPLLNSPSIYICCCCMRLVWCNRVDRLPRVDRTAHPYVEGGRRERGSWSYRRRDEKAQYKFCFCIFRSLSL